MLQRNPFSLKNNCSMNLMRFSMCSFVCFFLDDLGQIHTKTLLLKVMSNHELMSKALFCIIKTFCEICYIFGQKIDEISYITPLSVRQLA